MNIFLISYQIDDLNTSIINFKNKPNVTGIPECRVKTSRPALSNIKINNYSYEYTPTEPSNGGTLLYIDNKLQHGLRKDLALYKSREKDLALYKSRQKRKAQL